MEGLVLIFYMNSVLNMVVLFFYFVLYKVLKVIFIHIILQFIVVFVSSVLYIARFVFVHHTVILICYIYIVVQHNLIPSLIFSRMIILCSLVLTITICTLLLICLLSNDFRVQSKLRKMLKTEN